MPVRMGDGSKRVTRRMHDFPRQTAAQLGSTPTAIGVTAPRPVTTTRLWHFCHVVESMRFMLMLIQSVAQNCCGEPRARRSLSAWHFIVIRPGALRLLVAAPADPVDGVTGFGPRPLARSG